MLDPDLVTLRQQAERGARTRLTSLSSWLASGAISTSCESSQIVAAAMRSTTLGRDLLSSWHIGTTPDRLLAAMGGTRHGSHNRARMSRPQSPKCRSGTLATAARPGTSNRML
jgi:hypothetical protein